MKFDEQLRTLLQEDVACTWGHDAGPIVHEMQAYCGQPSGTPWCADTASWAGHKAMIDAGSEDPTPWFKTASSQHMLALAVERGAAFDDPQELLQCQGAIMIYTDPDGVHGHVIPIVGRLTDANGSVVAVRTIEGNSDTAPHNAVASLIRSATEATKGRKISFIDISDVPGCDYWPADA